MLCHLYWYDKCFQAPMYYRKANAAMLVFDITSVDSFGDMKTWVNGKSSNLNF